MPVVGFLYPGSPEETASLRGAFRKGFAEVDYEEGRNVAIEYRWAEHHVDRLPTLAAQLVQQNVAVIAAVGGTLPALAAKAAPRRFPLSSTLAMTRSNLVLLPASLGLAAT
jgi:putative ABC transport system substrate-binding protein